MRIVHRRAEHEAVRFLRLLRKFIDAVIENALTKLCAFMTRDTVCQWLVSDGINFGINALLLQ